MLNSGEETFKKVVIASANPLFGRGLERLLIQRWGRRAVQIRLTADLQATLAAMDDWKPDLVIVDYDDRAIHRAEFLSHFVSGDRPMQVLLASLQASGEMVAYDRRTLTTAQMEDWLALNGPPAFPEGKKDAPAARHLDPGRRKGGSMRHYVIVGFLVGIMTVIVYVFLTNVGLLPEQASLQAQPIDRLFHAEFLVISFLFSLITVFLLYSVIVFRKRAGEPDRGANFKGSNKLEVVWTVVPLITVLVFSYYGSQNLAETRRVDPQAMVINVTAGQWFWSFEYPDQGVSATSLHVPVNRQILFRLTSQDVIHSFWVPQWRVKQDVLPGENMVRELRVTPTETGEFTLLCAEMCGGAHAYMTAPVVVMEREEFSQWLQEQATTSAAGPVELGRKLAESNGCTACHKLDGSKGIGPTWKGLYESQVQLTGGETVSADEQYLHTAIVDPNAQIPAGFQPNIMPQNYSQKLSEEEISALVEFIQSLK